MLTYAQDSGFSEADDPGGDAFGEFVSEKIGSLSLRLRRPADGADHGFHALVGLDDARQCLVGSEADLLALAQVIAQLHVGSLAAQLARLLPTYLRNAANGMSIGLASRALATALEEE